MIKRKLARIIEQPRVLYAWLKGIKPTYAFYCLTCEELLGEKPKKYKAISI